VKRRLASIPGWVWPLAMFCLALAPRLPGLGLFLTTDEPFFAGQAADVVTALLRADFSATYWHFYPGLTISWLDGLGMLLQWGLLHVAGPTPEPFTQFIRRDVLELLIAQRLPYALLIALFVVALYELLRRLTERRTALIGALFVAFDPFVLAHSRVAHGDGPVMVFMGVAVLAFMLHLRRDAAGRRLVSSWLVLSAACGGLAALTKSPGPFVLPFVILLGLGDWLVRDRVTRPGRRVGQLAAWCALAGSVFVVLWPAMWVDPVGTLGRMFEETFGKVEAGHLVYFIGQPTLDPGPWFYPYVTTFRLTPVVWLGFLLCVACLVLAVICRAGAPRTARGLRRRSQERAVAEAECRAGAPRTARGLRRRSQGWQVAVVCALFVFGLLLFGELSPKKQDRYLLAMFPFLDVLAAFGYVWWAERAGAWVSRTADRPGLHWHRPAAGLAAGAVVIAAHAYPVLTAYPYYLAYFNPLMGGLPRAVETTLVGWGEGMEQAAAYLNRQPDAEHAVVAAVPAQTLLPYFRGSGENFYTNDVALRADWVVLYVSQVQRLAPSPEIVQHYRALQPAHVVTVLGEPYVWVYASPRAITADLPADATPTNVGLSENLRLAGYRVATRNGATMVMLFWHALGVLETDYTISVRLVGTAGDRLSQHDGWPVDGLLPTRQLRPGDYVHDVHMLKAPADAVVAAIEVVVYDAASGQPLGAPIELDAAIHE
jgi:4-amino-4-deoxy-L-arabinose transferase-like glycosyltransferase